MRALTNNDPQNVQRPTTARWIAGVYWVAMALSTHTPGLAPPSTGQVGLGFDVNFDKVIHIGAFAVLTALLVAARLAGRNAKPLRNLVVATLVAGAYAYLDELTQGPFGRQFSLFDLLSNLAGVLVVAAVLMPLFAARVRSDLGPMILARLMFVIVAPFGVMSLFTSALQFDIPVPLPMGPSTGELFEPRMDQILHLLGAMALVWLLSASRPFGRRRRWQAIVFAILFVAISGPAIELVQSHLDRGFEWSDLIAHELGLVLASFIGLAHVLGRGASPPPALQPDPDRSEEAVARPQGAEEQQIASAGFVGHSRTVGLLTLVSRFAGLVRESALGAVFSLTGITDAFVIGFMVPNLFRRLFGEGALSAAFIPTYAELLKTDRLCARRFAWLCVALVLVVVGALALLGEVGLAIALAGREWSAESSLAIRLTMTMLPYAPLVCLVALFAGLLQVHGRFGPPAAMPILLNVFMIGAIAIVSLGDGSDQTLRRSIFIIAASVLIAGLVQLAWLALTAIRFEPFTRNFQGTGKAFRQMATVMLPMVFGLAVFQINVLLDMLIAVGLSPKADGPDMLNIFGWQVAHPIASSGAAAALGFAQRLYQFPLGVFGIAIATAIFPALSHAAAGGVPLGQFRTIFRQGLRLTMFIGLPATAGLILVRVPLVRAIFEYHKFSLEDSQRVATILAGYGSAVWAYSMTHVVTRAFYALKDSRTPLVISVIMVFFNLTLNLTLVWYMGAAGLAWSTAITAVCQTILMLLAIRKHIDAPVDRHVVLAWLRCAIITAIMTIVLILIMMRYDAVVVGRGQSALLLVTMVGMGIIVFVAGAWISRADELKWLLTRKRKEVDG